MERSSRALAALSACAALVLLVLGGERRPSSVAQRPPAPDRRDRTPAATSLARPGPASARSACSGDHVGGDSAAAKGAAGCGPPCAPAPLVETRARPAFWGRVLVGGRPVAGVEVRRAGIDLLGGMELSRDAPRRAAATDEDGVFSLPVHPGLAEDVVLVDRERGWAVGRIDGLHPSRAQVRAFRLRPVAALEADVEEESGRRCSGALVRLSLHEDDGTEPQDEERRRRLTWTAETDPAGRASFDWLPAGESFDALVLEPLPPEQRVTSRSFDWDGTDGLRVLWREEDALFLAPGERANVLWRTGEASLALTVRRASGLPYVGPIALVPPRGAEPWAEVAFPGLREPWGETSASGELVLEHVPFGTWRAGVPGLLLASRAELADAPGVGRLVQVSSSAPAHVELRLPATRFVAGRVLGADVPIRLELREQGGSRVLRGSSARDGSFRLGPLLPGRYRLSAGDGWALLEPREVEAGEEDVLVLVARGARLAASVAGLEPGVPLWGTLYGPDGGPAADGHADGAVLRFEGLAPDTYTLVAEGEDGSIGVLEGVVLGPGEVRAGSRVELERGARAVLRARGSAALRVRLEQAGCVLADARLAGRAALPVRIAAGAFTVEVLWAGAKVRTLAASARAGEELVLDLSVR